MFKFIEAYFIESNRQMPMARIASHVAHKINNPLAIILTCTEKLRSKPDMSPECLEEQLRRIEANVMRISKTIDQLQNSDDEIPPTLP